MKRKNIAVIMTALDTDNQAEVLKGIEQCGMFNGCNVAVFVWFTGVYEKERHNQGEVNIAMLPDLNLFDGIILSADAFHMKENKECIEQMLETVSTPIVTIGCKYKNAPAVWSDNYAGMRDLMEYLVKDRGMKNLHFVKGIDGNVDAEARYKAYLDVLKENRIPVEEERITHGDFYVIGGEMAAKAVLESSLPFPEAIVCSNDTMAITVYDVLSKNGYRVPEDVVITGYDYSYECRVHYPQIVSVRVNSFEVGLQACEALLQLMKGEAAEQDYRVSDEVMLDEARDGSVRKEIIRSFAKKGGGSDFTRRIMIHHLINFEKNIAETVGFDSWKNIVQDFVRQVNPGEFYCCVNKGFINNVFRNATVEQETRSAAEWLAYTEDAGPVIAYKDGMFFEKEPFPSKYALDTLFQEDGEPRLYIFSPLHYLDRNYGYLVFADSTFPIGNPLYIIWLNSIGSSVENMRKHTMLINAMVKLDDATIRDPLTGVYNRFGMERYFAIVKEKCIDRQMFLHLSFADIDGLKKINDVYGHEEGDRIIRDTGRILQEEAGDAYVVRYGGDEFVVMGTVFSEQEAVNYWTRVQKAIKKYNAKHEGGAEMSISSGYDLIRLDPYSILDDCIGEADKRMYVEKNRKKAEKAKK
ncbi:MAG: GGDEF domain-containing protein [Lachnospiraceae bacterium]|nr:GGDEF domain-containing protein [Lachnospiraceae bacterium]